MPQLKLHDAKQQLGLEGYDDQRALKIIQQAYYPDMDIGEIGNAFGIQPEKAAPIAPERDDGFWSSAGDFALSGVSGIASGLSSALKGGSEMANVAAEMSPMGITREEAEFLAPRISKEKGQYVSPQEILKTNQRSSVFGLASQGLNWTGDQLQDFSEYVGSSRSQNAIDAQELSTPQGDITDSSTWSPGQSPSVEGYAHHAIQGAGSLAPMVATWALTGGTSLSNRIAAMMATEGAQVTGSALQEAQEIVKGLSGEELLKTSPIYRQSIEAGATPQQARAEVDAEVKNKVAGLALPIGTIGGAATGAVFGPMSSKAASHFASKGILGATTKALAVGGTAGIEEGIQETAEGVGTKLGVNLGTGRQDNVLEDSLGNAVLGAMSGGLIGGAKGIVTDASQPTDAPPTTPTTEDATQNDGDSVVSADNSQPQIVPDDAIQQNIEQEIAQEARRQAVAKAGDEVRAAKVEEAGPISRATNTGIEASAQQAEDEAGAGFDEGIALAKQLPEWVSELPIEQRGLAVDAWLASNSQEVAPEVQQQHLDTLNKIKADYDDAAKIDVAAEVDPDAPSSIVENSEQSVVNPIVADSTYQHDDDLSLRLMHRQAERDLQSLRRFDDGDKGNLNALSKGVLPYAEDLIKRQAAAIAQTQTAPTEQVNAGLQANPLTEPEDILVGNENVAGVNPELQNAALTQMPSEQVIEGPVVDGTKLQGVVRGVASDAQPSLGLEQDAALGDIDPVQESPVQLTKEVVTQRLQQADWRTDATPKTQEDSVNIFEELASKKGAIVANAITADLLDRGSTNLLGKQVQSSEDLATIAQVYRDPRVETSRYFFVKNSKIVGHTGLTLNLPSRSVLTAGEDREAYIAQINQQMAALGADKLYVLHNHPSGDPTPSESDIASTKYLSQKIKGFAAHVILDSNKFSQITVKKDAQVKVTKRFFGEDKSLEPSVPHDQLRKFINTPKAIALVGQSFKKDGFVTLIGADDKMRVRGVMEVPQKDFSNVDSLSTTLIIRNFAKQTGAMGGVSIVGFEGDPLDYKSLIERGFLTDAVNAAGVSARAKGVKVKDGVEGWLGKSQAHVRVVDEAFEKTEAATDAPQDSAQPKQAETDSGAAIKRAADTKLTKQQSKMVVDAFNTSNRYGSTAPIKYVSQINSSKNIEAKSDAFTALAESLGYEVSSIQGKKYLALSKGDVSFQVRVSDHKRVNQGQHSNESVINLAPNDGTTYYADTFATALWKLENANSIENEYGGALHFGKIPEDELLYPLGHGDFKTVAEFIDLKQFGIDPVATIPETKNKTPDSYAKTTNNVRGQSAKDLDIQPENKGDDDVTKQSSSSVQGRPEAESPKDVQQATKTRQAKPIPNQQGSRDGQAAEAVSDPIASARQVPIYTASQDGGADTSNGRDATKGRRGAKGRDNAGRIPRQRQRVQGSVDSAGDGGTGGRISNDSDKSSLDYTINPESLEGSTTPAAKYTGNIAAIKTLLTLEKEGRAATDSEKDVLAKYSGWGGLKNAFFLGQVDDINEIIEHGDIESSSHNRGQSADWLQKRIDLVQLLGKDEYRSARASTPNSHFTAPEVVQSMWDGLKELGFAGGRVLEPSMGIGAFFGLMPADIRAKSNLSGVELDSISGRISRQLYPSADIRIEGFEKAKFPDGYFDVAIGNVPFGDYSVNDPKYNKRKLSIHNYFIAKSLDKVRSGGVVAVVTSSFTLDQSTKSVRDYLASKAEFLGAIRLPNNAFKKSANTDVVADILFLRKRSANEVPRAGEKQWVDLERYSVNRGNVAKINSYFAQNPQNMLGKPVMESSGMYGNMSFTVKADDRDIKQAIRDAFKGIKPSKADAITFGAKGLKKPAQQPTVLAEDGVKEGALVEKAGKVYVNKDGQLIPQKDLHKAAPLVKSMRDVVGAVRSHFKKQLESKGDSAIKQTQAALNSAYDAFVSEFGFIHLPKNKKVLSQDPDYPLLLSLENWDSQTSSATKADLFSRRTLSRSQEVLKADSVDDALNVSLNELGGVDISRIAELTGAQEADVIEQLNGKIYQNPITQQWESAQNYLSGNVRIKLQQAQDASENDKAFVKNVEALKQVQPDDLTSDQIQVKLGASWIPPSIIGDFVHSIVPHQWDSKPEVLYSNLTSEWRLVFKNGNPQSTANSETYGTPDYSGTSLIELTLNLQKPKVYIPLKDNKRILDKEKTLAAREKQEVIQTAFKEWIFADDSRTKKLMRIYNDEFNSIRPATYDGSHLTLPNVNSDIELRQNVKDGAWRIVSSGNNVLLAHAVGAGKTYTMIAGGMELKRLGLANKPMYVVPNHMLEQFSKDFLGLYPAANLLIARKEDLAKEKRKQFSARVATGAWDGVIITHSSFGKIGMSQEAIDEHIRAEIRSYEDAILEAAANSDDSRLQKRLEVKKKKLEAKLEKSADQSKKDDVIVFEDLGVDQLFVDEAHMFKNLGFVTKMERISGISDSDSKRAFDLHMKTQYLTGLHNGQRGVVFATGTPISNSVTEMYTMQRYLDMNGLKESGLTHFDSWAANFGEVVSRVESRPDGGGYRVHSRFSKFTNVPELMQRFRQVADIKTAEMLKLPVPKIKDGKAQVVTAKPSAELKEFIATLVDRADAISKARVAPDVDNMLKITSEGRKAALDLRLIDKDAKDDPNSKINAAVGHIHRIWKSSKAVRGTQLVFSDLSTPKNGQFSIYQDIKDKLVKKGIPEQEIQFIHDFNTDESKGALFRDVNNGKVRVLIGSTEKMGAGTNVQERLIGLHQLDAPWRPSDVEQRDGRILRQGNSNQEVEILRYVTEATFDVYSWQTLETKAAFTGQVMRGDENVRQIEDLDGRALSFAEVKALATGNPLIIEKSAIDAKVSDLSRSATAHAKSKRRLQASLVANQARLANTAAYIEKVNKDALAMQSTKGDKFVATIGGSKVTTRQKAGDLLEAAITAGNYRNPVFNNKLTPKPLGQMGGFDLKIQHSNSGHATVVIVGEALHNVELGMSASGNITKIENAIAAIPQKLEAAKLQKANAESEIEVIKEQLSKPFDKEAELNQALKRQSQIDFDLGLDQDDSATDDSDQESPLEVQVDIDSYRADGGIKGQITNRLNDALTTKKTFNWLHKTVGTQYHKAWVDEDYGRVYRRTQDYLHDVASFAKSASDLAPSILPSLESFSDMLKKPANRKDLDAAGQAIFKGTLLDEKVYSDKELASDFDLDKSQIALYREYRAAIDASLDNLGKTEILFYAGKFGKDVAEQVMNEPDLSKATKILLDNIGRFVRKAKTKQVENSFLVMRSRILAKKETIIGLKERGYAPLMRFGKYTLSVKDPKTQEQLYFGIFERESEANAMRREMDVEYHDADISQGILNEDEYKLFQGVDLATLEIFGSALGQEENEIFQKFLRLTKSNHSAMKRMISRKGIAGFSTDTSRTLAAFITSNARQASKNMHFAELKKEVRNIPREKGDVAKEATKLVEYIQNPEEEAAAIRGLMFLQYIGGSIASSLVNLTQVPMMTFPHLAQFDGAGNAAKRLSVAFKQATAGVKNNPVLSEALAKAEKQGIVSPQEIHQLQAEAMKRGLLVRPVGGLLGISESKLKKAEDVEKRLIYLWGSLFSLAEQYNRRVTFIASYETALAMKEPDPFKFASSVVEYTQGVYNKGNRPNWARGAVGATIFTFKQYSIGYVEFLVRLPPKQKAIALAMLILAAGIEGLPFMEDIDDVIVTIGQRLGYNTNVKQWREDVITKAFGEEFGQVILYGTSSIPGIPLDYSARLGLPNLIPMSGVGREDLSQAMKLRNSLEVLGVAGSMATDLITGRGGIPAWDSTAFNNAKKAYDMYKTGWYRDSKGRRVIDVDGVDAFVKLLGFQPSDVAKESRAMWTQMQSINMLKNKRSELAAQWAEGIVEKDQQKVIDAKKAIVDWNTKNPDSRITGMGRIVQRRIKEMRKLRFQRFIKTTPKSMRPSVISNQE